MDNISDEIKKIARNALETRPKKDVYYMFCESIPGIGFEKNLGNMNIDLNKLYPDSRDGDVCAVDFMISPERTYDMYINISGNVCVYYNGKRIFLNIDGKPGEMFSLPVRAVKGKKNFVRVTALKSGENFGFKLVLSVKRYPEMWANDYLFAARAVCPVKEYYGEEGFGVTKCQKTCGGIEGLMTKLPEEYEYPKPPSGNEAFDFDGSGVYYVYTEAAVNHRFKTEGYAEKLFVNGALRKNMSCNVKKGDKILVKFKKNLKLDTDKLCLSFVKSCRGVGDKAVYIGPFFGGGVNPPEFDWDFSTVFQNSDGTQLFWKNCRGADLRIYLDSVFYGQWFYALMVGFYGLRKSGIYLNDSALMHLFCDNMCFLAKYFAYAQYDAKQHMMPAFMPRASIPNVLDNLGTMGTNFIDCYFDCNNPRLMPVIEKIAQCMENEVPRFPDGTFFRVDTMWADDLYMSCLFLIRMGFLKNDTVWFEKAASQIEGFKERLYMKDKGLFSHIYFTNDEKASNVAWGRGNGWVMWTLSEFIMLAGEKYRLDGVKDLFCEMAYSLLKYQDKTGLWRQVIDKADDGSYLETSCSAMFLLAFSRGIRMGILPKDIFLPAARRAYEGIKKHCIDKNGNVTGVCMGSGCARDAEYYYDIPTAVNDDHGTGVILAAFCEYGGIAE